MSSPTSPILVEHRDLLLAAVGEVAENSLFAFADASDEAAFSAAASAGPGDGGSAWLHASVHFKGSIAGRFELTMPEPLARHLCTSFAGADSADDVADGDVIDFAGELANMVCGAWLTRAYRREAFDLMPPSVGRGQPDVGQPGDAGSERFYLSIDEAPIRLALAWETADSAAGERVID